MVLLLNFRFVWFLKHIFPVKQNAGLSADRGGGNDAGSGIKWWAAQNARKLPGYRKENFVFRDAGFTLIF